MAARPVPIAPIPVPAVIPRRYPIGTGIWRPSPIAVVPVAVLVIIPVNPQIPRAGARRPVGMHHNPRRGNRHRPVVGRPADLHAERDVRLREERPTRYYHQRHQFRLHCGPASFRAYIDARRVPGSNSLKRNVTIIYRWPNITARLVEFGHRAGFAALRERIGQTLRRPARGADRQSELTRAVYRFAMKPTTARS